MKKLLIFDYDGVIVDSLDVMVKVVNKLLKKCNFKRKLLKEEVAAIFDVNFSEGIKKLGIDEKEIKKHSYVDKDFIKYRHEIKPFEGIIEVIKRLSQKNTVIIVSSNISEVVEDFLKENELEACVKEVIGIKKEPSKVKKIEYCKGKYGMDNESIFYIGDTKGDMIEGKKAGVKTVAVTWGFHNKNKLQKENPDFIVETPEELLELFL